MDILKTASVESIIKYGKRQANLAEGLFLINDNCVVYSNVKTFVKTKAKYHHPIQMTYMSSDRRTCR